MVSDSKSELFQECDFVKILKGRNKKALILVSFEPQAIVGEDLEWSLTFWASHLQGLFLKEAPTVTQSVQDVGYYNLTYTSILNYSK